MILQVIINVDPQKFNTDSISYRVARDLNFRLDGSFQRLILNYCYEII